ncbi:MAG: sterol desaturase family protein [Alphaproteobacteria bacterium]|nr:sterol desaturase family protein [Alphaproteobacteria bacterium]
MSFPDPVKWAIPVFILLVVAEMVYGRLTGRVRFETRDTLASLTMGLGNLVSGLAFGFLLLWAYDLAYAHRLFDIGYSWWAFLACFLAEDLAYYWFHRVSHERRLFWASHVVHHSSQHYNLSTALRQTWTGKLAFTFIFWIPLMLIGFPPAMVIFFSGLSLVYQFWIHTEAIGRMGPFEWIFNTPSHHRVHHATNPKYLDANYAGVLIVWDRLFGSFVPEDRAEPCEYGIIKRLGTFNPLVIAFHEWVAMGRDALSARSLRGALGYLFGPPGWREDGTGRTVRVIKAELAARQAEVSRVPAAAK